VTPREMAGSAEHGSRAYIRSLGGHLLEGHSMRQGHRYQVASLSNLIEDRTRHQQSTPESRKGESRCKLSLILPQDFTCQLQAIPA
jgi:hypothetical protein